MSESARDVALIQNFHRIAKHAEDLGFELDWTTPDAIEQFFYLGTEAYTIKFLTLSDLGNFLAGYGQARKDERRAINE